MALDTLLEAVRAAVATATSQSVYLDTPALLSSGTLTTAPKRYVDIQYVYEDRERDLDGFLLANPRITVTAWSREYGEVEATSDTIITTLESSGWEALTRRSRGLDDDYWGISVDAQTRT